VKYLLEPQLVCLVDGNKEKLVMVCRIGPAVLQTYQVLNPQIVVV
jgi:hypothetical protein